MSVIQQKSLGVSGVRVASLLFCVFTLCAGAAFGGGYGTKFILHGWDLGNTTPENVLAHADQLNKLPIAGVTVRLADVKQADGSTICAETLPSDVAWRRESVAPLLPVYREISKYENLKHSFISCSIVPRGTRFDWRDDAEWARIAGNLKVLAYAAKAGGLKGLCIDNEDYTGSKQFSFLAADGSYEDTVALVRKRGAQLFKAVFGEYPDITLLWFWAFSNARLQSAADDPAAALKESGRLLPAFLNGMLDVIPPEAVFVDGDEDSYSFEASRGDFNKAALQILSHVLPYVAPENRAKYRAQVRNSFGLYLDEFTGGKYRTSGKRKGQPNHWYRRPVNGSRAEHFREILEGAVYAADEYVWLYGEQYSYIDWGDTIKPKEWAQFSTTETWDDMIGLSAKLELAKNPDAYARKCLEKFRADPGAVNLLANVKGVEVKGAECTSFITHEQMTNRNYFVVSAELKGGNADAILRWQKDQNWNWEPGGVRKVELKPEDPADAEGWT
ncbi:MAG TPA: hypothetical protein PKI32_09585, partial [Opitutales bacterium]|nr:hypothetical protein [Opitutales bacterium]